MAGPRQKQVREYRGQMPSPGRPTIAWREDRVRFWATIATGVLTDEASDAAGVSAPQIDYTVHLRVCWTHEGPRLTKSC